MYTKCGVSTATGATPATTSPAPPTGPISPPASQPSQACVAAWNAATDAATGACGPSGALQGCCAALGGLSQDCLADIAAAMAADPKYKATLDAL